MKQGRSLQELAIELERQQEQKRDFVASTQNVVATLGGPQHTIPELQLAGVDGPPLQITEVCHDQLAANLEIPAKYYDRMRHTQPTLWRTSVNTWLHHNPEQRLLRTLDGKARAFLSDRYRPLDNYDLMNAVLPKLITLDGIKIDSCEITEKRLYIKALYPKVQSEMRQGDVVQAGLMITNSEVGLSSVKIEPLIFRLACLNGMIAKDHSVKKYHIGKRHEGIEFDNAYELLTDETRAADDAVFWRKVSDVAAAALSKEKFEAIIARHRRATEVELKHDPVKVVEVTAKKYGTNMGEQATILHHLIQGGDLTQYGLAQAITRTAQDVESYDRSVELERIGGQVIELEPSAWKTLEVAA